jgi:hypothetical protein
VHTLQFIFVKMDACLRLQQQTQGLTLNLIALAVSRHGPQTVSELVLSETDVAAIVLVIGHHI